MDTGRQHPSQDIPNAAYPDAPYQPGGLGHTEGVSGLVHSPGLKATGPMSPTPSLSQTHAHSQPKVEAWSALEASKRDTVSDPPPPYNPDQDSTAKPPGIAAAAIASSSSPDGSLSRGTNSGDIALENMAPGSTQNVSPPGPQRSLGPHAESPHTMQSALASSPGAMESQSDGSGFVEDNDKNSALDKSRSLQRRKRIRILIMLAAIAIVIIAAILLGVGFTVIRRLVRDNGDDDDDDSDDDDDDDDDGDDD